jgi:hypothetical protein
MLRLNTKQTVGDFKKSLSEFCGLPASKINLFFSHHKFNVEGGFGGQFLKYPNKMVYSLLVEEGDSFEIFQK